MPKAPSWHLYLIRCGDDSLYCGIATDVTRRLAEHNSQGPKSAKYLRGRLPLKLVFQKKVGNRAEATREEIRIKRLSRAQKERLITLPPT